MTLKRDPYRVELALLLLSFPIHELVSSMQIAVHFWFSYKIYLVIVQTGTFQAAVALMQDKTQGSIDVPRR